MAAGTSTEPPVGKHKERWYWYRTTSWLAQSTTDTIYQYYALTDGVKPVMLTCYTIIEFIKFN